MAFRSQSLFFMIPVLVVVSLIYTYESLRTEKDIVRNEIIKRAETITTLATKTGELPLLSGNPELLKGTVSFLRANSEVSSVTFYDSKMAMLIHDGLPISKAVISLPPDLAISMSEENDSFVFYAPVFTVRTQEDFDIIGESDNVRKVRENIGWIRLSFSKSSMRENGKRIVARGLVLAVVFATGSSILVYFLISMATKPLLVFTRHVEEIRGKKGEERLLPVASSDEIGRLTQAFNAMVTDLDRQQEELQESEAKFKNFAEQSLVGIYLLQDGKFNYANPRFAEIFGYTTEELLDNMSFENLVLPEDLSMVAEQIKKRISGEMGHSHYEFRGIKKNKEIIHIEIYASVIIYNKRQATIGTSLDITEHKKLEEQLRQTQKMEAIGTLAGGIAHDFNNILTAIMGYGNLLKMRLGEDNPLNGYAAEILASCERAASLTHSLLAFSRKQAISPRSVNLNEIVKKIEKFLLRIIGEDIEFKTLLSDGDVTVMADSSQIEQVLMNLATNARDAMPNGGSLIIKTERLDLNREIAGQYDYIKPGAYAVISVSDTGAGMDALTRQRIFEAFFTTKEVGKGTGLGLSIVYGIIKQHDGEINVYSEPGKGTTFRIYLKLVQSKVEKDEASELPRPSGGSETILVAEDDADVRRFMKSILEEFGYAVIEAVDGEDAVNKFVQNKDRVQLLILDVVMPRKNGKETYEEIRKIRIDVPVLFSSGYTADIITKKGILEEGINFISKPVTPHLLLSKIREALSQ
jgi:PAS domain S-box-containing protein